VACEISSEALLGEDLSSLEVGKLRVSARSPLPAWDTSGSIGHQALQRLKTQNGAGAVAAAGDRLRNLVPHTRALPSAHFRRARGRQQSRLIAASLIWLPLCPPRSISAATGQCGLRHLRPGTPELFKRLEKLSRAELKGDAGAVKITEAVFEPWRYEDPAETCCGHPEDRRSALGLADLNGPITCTVVGDRLPSFAFPLFACVRSANGLKTLAVRGVRHEIAVA
jgi:hypothetical protein